MSSRMQFVCLSSQILILYPCFKFKAIELHVLLMEILHFKDSGEFLTISKIQGSSPGVCYMSMKFKNNRLKRF